MTAITGNFSDLYHAQRVAQTVTTQVSWFPCYSREYLQAQSGIQRALLVTYSTSYDIVQAIGHGLSVAVRTVIKGIEFVASRLLSPFYCIYNAVYPINPINGERHLILISRSLEKKLGDWVFYPLATAHVLPTYELLANSYEPIADRVDEVAQKIFQANRTLINPPGETPFDYRAMTVASSQLNAFSVSGGGMVVYSQLVKEIHAAILARKIQETTVQMPDGSSVVVDLRDVTLDDALAGLMGHEITHAASRHSMMQLVAQLLLEVPIKIAKGILLLLIGREASDADAVGDQTRLRYLSLLEGILHFLDHHIQNFSARLLSRRAEYEADVTGAYLAHRASFNPLGAIYAQEIFMRAASLPWVHENFEFTFTHPFGKNRERAILAGIQSFAPEKLKGHLFTEERPEIPIYDTRRDRSARASADLHDWIAKKA